VNDIQPIFPFPAVITEIYLTYSPSSKIAKSGTDSGVFKAGLISSNESK